MPEPYGSHEFRESLKFPNTRVGIAMQQLSDGLASHGSFITAVMEDQFKRMGDGKPGEDPQDPVPFNIGGTEYSYSVSPQPRLGFLIDDAISLTRGEDSILLQVSHRESDPTQIKDEAVLNTSGQTFEGEEAIERIPNVFPEFTPKPAPVAA